MPTYEMAHVTDPGRPLFEHVKFSSAGKRARLLEGNCQENKERAAAVCIARYEFAAPVDGLDVECTLHAITVPNHVHLLRAEKAGGQRDQAIFDFSFEKATL